MIAAGAFRWRTREIRIGLERREELRVEPPGRGPCAVAIEGFAGVALAPGVEQRVAGSRIEPTHRSHRREVCDAGHAAYGDDDAMPILPPVHRSVQGSHPPRGPPPRR